VPVFPAQLAESACWKAAVAGSADAGGLAVVAELDLESAHSPISLFILDRDSGKCILEPRLTMGDGIFVMLSHVLARHSFQRFLLRYSQDECQIRQDTCKIHRLRH